MQILFNAFSPHKDDFLSDRIKHVVHSYLLKIKGLLSEKLRENNWTKLYSNKIYDVYRK